MNWNKKQIGYILYNNRSVEGVVNNFFDPNLDAQQLIDIESKFEWSKSLYEELDSMVEVDISLLDSKASDIVVHPKDLHNLTPLVISKIGLFSESESQYLSLRKIDSSIINKFQILGLSNFVNMHDLEIIGATTHPILHNFIQNGISSGGIVIPLFESGKLINCSIRSISDIGKLKYTLAVPDIPVWGLDDVDQGEDLFITEGLFDLMAVSSNGKKCVSPSSAVWSGIQLYKLLQKNPKSITIFCDNDRVGLKNGLILSKFFNLCKISNSTVISTCCKDAAEHFFEKKLGWSEITNIDIDTSMIDKKKDNSFDFLKYLQKRRF